MLYEAASTCSHLSAKPIISPTAMSRAESGMESPNFLFKWKTLDKYFPIKTYGFLTRSPGEPTCLGCKAAAHGANRSQRVGIARSSRHLN